MRVGFLFIQLCSSFSLSGGCNAAMYVVNPDTSQPAIMRCIFGILSSLDFLWGVEAWVWLLWTSSVSTVQYLVFDPQRKKSIGLLRNTTEPLKHLESQSKHISTEASKNVHLKCPFLKKSLFTNRLCQCRVMELPNAFLNSCTGLTLVVKRGKSESLKINLLMTSPFLEHGIC